jgi:hypothetical protein
MWRCLRLRFGAGGKGHDRCSEEDTRLFLARLKTLSFSSGYHTFDGSNINFSAILRVKAPVAQYVVTQVFIKALKNLNWATISPSETISLYMHISIPVNESVYCYINI